MKKELVSFGIAASLGLTGCSGGSADVGQRSSSLDVICISNQYIVVDHQTYVAPPHGDVIVLVHGHHHNITPVGKEAQCAITDATTEDDEAVVRQYTQELPVGTPVTIINIPAQTPTPTQ